jgi:hypothetical protein
MQQNEEGGDSVTALVSMIFNSDVGYLVFPGEGCEIGEGFQGASLRVGIGVPYSKFHENIKSLRWTPARVTASASIWYGWQPTMRSSPIMNVGIPVIPIFSASALNESTRAR